MNWKELEKFVEKMNTSKEEIELSMKRKIRHLTFAKALVYFYYLDKKDGFVYPSEIARKLKTITTARAWQILGELEKLGFAKRVERGGDKVFVVKNRGELEKWVEEAMETIKENESSL